MTRKTTVRCSNGFSYTLPTELVSGKVPAASNERHDLKTPIVQMCKECYTRIIEPSHPDQVLCTDCWYKLNEK